jgi:hypothetical protein
MMSPGCLFVFPGSVTRPTDTSARVALAATPLLLAESLRSLMPAQAEVTVVLDGPVRGHYDIAIVTGDSGEIDAEIVIRLDDQASSRGGGTVVFADGSPQERLGDLSSVVRFLEDSVVAHGRLGCG